MRVRHICTSRGIASAISIPVLLALAAPVGAGSPASALEERPPVARCATAGLRALIGDTQWAASRLGAGEPRGMDVPLPCDHTPVGPPPNPQVGSSWNWYIWRLNGFPQADLRSCTVRGMGDHCYVVVEDTQWNVNINQQQVDTIVQHFEQVSIGPFPGQGIWSLDTTHFGDPPDNLDQDPRVYILYYDFDVNADGFFWIFDQECDDTADFHSNECDVVYMNCSDFDPAGPYLLAVLAHEFEHLIHHNYDANEDPWVDEGLAEVAMWLYGNPDNIVSFNTNPDRNLTTFDGSFVDYVKSYLWSLYFYERYGGQAAMRAAVAEPANSTLGYENVLDDLGYVANFTDVFADWVVANYLDDTSIGDGRFGYLGETLPPFSPFATHSTYPVGPLAASVQNWAADYVRYRQAENLFVTFDGSNTNRYAVRALVLDDISPTQVVDMTLDASQAGSLSLPQVGDTHDEAVVVHASIQSTGGTAYTYGATANVVTVGNPAVTAGKLALTAHHASRGVVLRMDVPESRQGEEMRLDLFDLEGRLVQGLASGPIAGGVHDIEWDGRSNGVATAPGVYFARLRVGDDVRTTRVLHLP